MKQARWLSRSSAVLDRIETNRFREYFCNKNYLRHWWSRYALRNKRSGLLDHRIRMNINMNGQTRANIKPGMTVLIVLKQDQRTGKLTKGIVRDILTKSSNHPHGIKVRLSDGQVGRVKEIVEEGE